MASSLLFKAGVVISDINVRNGHNMYFTKIDLLLTGDIFWRAYMPKQADGSK
jgi:hypothetical protein